jgi:thioredoxin-like negative regulator of GroEL
MSSGTGSLEQVKDPASHDAAIAHAQNSGTVVVLYVTSWSNPICTSTTPKIESLAKNEKYGNVRFFQMELTPETAPMIKFGIQNTPIFILYRQRWCQTILGNDLRTLERLLDEQTKK